MPETQPQATGHKWNRRAFLRTAAAAAPAIAFGGETVRPLLGNRFLTFNSVIRVNQIEVTRTRTAGLDEVADHKPENVAAMREALQAGWPGARMTWGMSWRALDDPRPNYQQIREQLVSYQKKYGDEITFLPGAYFANAYNTREQVNLDLTEGLAKVSQMVGNGYRPRAVLAGFLAAENQRFLAEHEGIHVCQGNIWSQYAVDNQDGEGSICYPYYPSREHFCKPAQGAADFIDCVNLDGWTVDFLAGRRAGGAEGFNSRMGVGPIETIYAYGQEKGLQQMLGTTAVHFDDGFARNGFAWVTNTWEACLLEQFRRDRGWTGMDSLRRWLQEIRGRWPQAQCITLAEFGLAWRRQYPDNAKLDYRFVERGTGIGGSDASKQIRWFMNRDFRLALLKDWQNDSPEMVIDFTRYDLKAEEPHTLVRSWSLMNRLNQKRVRPQDEPVPFSKLTAAEQAFIRRHRDIA